jgi:hypothetical protein
MTATPAGGAAGPGAIYRLEVELAWAEPRIWRVLEVPGAASLDLLHRVLQVAFGWQDCHLHAFSTDLGEFGRPDWGQFDVADSTLVRVDEAAPVGGLFCYLYDFNADWVHFLRVTEIIEPVPGVRYPRCAAGERAGPVEDVGGLAAYERLIAALGDKEHPDHEAYVAALGDGETFDPERFCLDDVNRRLALLR